VDFPCSYIAQIQPSDWIPWLSNPDFSRNVSAVAVSNAPFRDSGTEAVRQDSSDLRERQREAVVLRRLTDETQDWKQIGDHFCSLSYVPDKS